jgi:hypothetical protein
MKNKLIRPLRWSGLLGLCMAIVFSLGKSNARGELLFFDSFEYPAGPLAGQGPPAGAPPGQTGWSLLAGNPLVAVQGLHFPRVFSVGGSAGLEARHEPQTVVANLTPVNSGVIWLGFLIRLTRGQNDGYSVINLTAGTGTSNFPGYGVLFFFPNVFGIDNDGPGFAPTTISPSRATTWIVVRIDFDSGTQDMYINPTGPGATPDAQLPMTSEFQTAGFSDLRLNSGASGLYQFDEVRIGTTFDDVRTAR